MRTMCAILPQDGDTVTTGAYGPVTETYARKDDTPAAIRHRFLTAVNSWEIEPNEEIQNMLQAIGEAADNAVEHSRGKLVKLQLEYDPGTRELCAEISDQGPGFNPDAMPDYSVCDSVECEGGMGVTIMRGFTTSTIWGWRGKWFVCQLIKIL